ncbi:MAG: NAD(P)-dependent oxidoreductase [Pseudomonadota bacterium]
MMDRLLLTGAAGGLATLLRPLLPNLARSVVLSDRVEVADPAPHESFTPCEMGDEAAVAALVEGVDGIIHLGGVSVERPFDQILEGNIQGVYNVFEGARKAGRPRIVFASSNHVIGFYRRDQRLDDSVPPRPDSLYGVSKAFGEALASLYHDKFGQECLSVRIGSCFAEPRNTRMLATWLAVEDFADLCACAFRAPRLGHALVYGASANDEVWWDNRNTAFLGWTPKRSAAAWRAEVMEATGLEDPASPEVVYQGGGFVAAPHPGSR